MIIYFNPPNHKLNKPFPYIGCFPSVFYDSNSKNLVNDDEYMLKEFAFGGERPSETQKKVTFCGL